MEMERCPLDGKRKKHADHCIIYRLNCEECIEAYAEVEPRRKVVESPLDDKAPISTGDFRGAVRPSYGQRLNDGFEILRGAE